MMNFSGFFPTFSNSNAFFKPEFLYISTHLRLSTHVEVLMMRRFTVSIPKELKGKLDAMPEINWSEVAKEGIIEKVKKLEKFEELERKGAI